MTVTTAGRRRTKRAAWAEWTAPPLKMSPKLRTVPERAYAVVVVVVSMLHFIFYFQ